MGVFEIISLIIAAAGGIATYFSNQQNVNNAIDNREDTQAFNAEQAGLANQREYQKYNDLYGPAARVEQLQKAGLSPALFYGGTGTQGTSTAGAQAQAGASPLPLINPILDMADMAGTMKASQEAQETQQTITNLQQEVTNMKEQVKNYEQERAESAKKVEMMTQEINNLKANEAATTLQNGILEIEKDIAEATKEERAEIIRKSLTKLNKDIEEATHRIGILEIEESKKGELMDAMTNHYKAAIRELGARAKLEAQQTVESEIKGWLGISEMSEISVKIDLMKKQGKLTDKQCERINVEMAKFNKEMELIGQQIQTEIEKTKLTGKEAKYYGAKAIAEIVDKYTHATKNLTSALTDIMNMIPKGGGGGTYQYNPTNSNSGGSFIY